MLLHEVDEIGAARNMCQIMKELSKSVPPLFSPLARSLISMLTGSASGNEKMDSEIKVLVVLVFCWAAFTVYVDITWDSRVSGNHL